MSGNVTREGTDQKLGKCQEKSRQGKLFIANCTFVAVLRILLLTK